MVRNYIRKTQRPEYSKDVVIEAVKSVVKDKKTVRSIALKYKVPRTTLERWCKKARTEDEIDNLSFSMGRFRNAFPEELEKKFVEILQSMSQKLFPLTPLDVRQLAFQYAELNNVHHKFNVNTRLAGQDWYVNFMKRNEDFKLRPTKEKNVASPGTSTAESSSTSIIDLFYNAVSELQSTHYFPATRIYIVSEAGVISIPKSTPDSQTSVLSTLTCCNAAGHFIPPLMVFPSAEKDPSFSNGCPPDTEIVCHPSGWVQKEIFYPTWFEHFLDHVSPKPKRPVLLLISGCTKYLMNVEIIEKAKQNYTHILCVPTGENPKLDPLECNFMVELKTNYVEQCKKYLSENPDTNINIHNIGKIYGIAYLKSATPLNAMHGFEYCGIHPFNRNALDENIAVPSSSTKQKIDEEESSDKPKAKKQRKSVPSKISKKNELIKDDSLIKNTENSLSSSSISNQTSTLARNPAEIPINSHNLSRSNYNSPYQSVSYPTVINTSGHNSNTNYSNIPINNHPHITNTNNTLMSGHNNPQLMSPNQGQIPVITHHHNREHIPIITQHQNREQIPVITQHQAQMCVGNHNQIPSHHNAQIPVNHMVNQFTQPGSYHLPYVQTINHTLNDCQNIHYQN